METVCCLSAEVRKLEWKFGRTNSVMETRAFVKHLCLEPPIRKIRRPLPVFLTLNKLLIFVVSTTFSSYPNFHAFFYNFIEISKSVLYFLCEINSINVVRRMFHTCLVKCSYWPIRARALNICLINLIVEKHFEGLTCEIYLVH